MMRSPTLPKYEAMLNTLICILIFTMFMLYVAKAPTTWPLLKGAIPFGCYQGCPYESSRGYQEYSCPYFGMESHTHTLFGGVECLYFDGKLESVRQRDGVRIVSECEISEDLEYTFTPISPASSR